MNDLKVKLIKSTFFNEEKTKKELCDFIMKTDRLSMWTECRSFETNFAKHQGAKNCSMFTSGSAANLALIQSLINLKRLNRGDTVAFSTVTWSTNVMPIIELGLKVHPVDVEIDTLNSSSKLFEQALDENPNIKAFFLTNVLGFCADIDKIAEICRKRNIILIEDNCESLGTVYKGKKLGAYGLAGTFSFYVGHHMSTIEGGALCTDDQDLDTMVKMVRSHGMDRNLDEDRRVEVRKKYDLDDFYSRYTFYTLGYNLRPNEINGFLGNNQLQYIDEIFKIRNQNFKKFLSAVNNNDIFPIRHEHIDFVSNFAFPVICKNKKTLNKYIKVFEEAGIEIRPVVSGNMMNQIFIKEFVSGKYNLPGAQKIHEDGFYFGNNPDMTQEEIDIVVKAFIDASK